MRAVLGLAIAFLLATPFAARAETPVDVELILAVDVSRSMTPRELEIQRRGYAEALVSDEVIHAIVDGFHRQVAIAYVEWAGTLSQRIVVDWTLIASRADAEAVAAKITAHFDNSMRRTSISGALDFTAQMFDANDFAGRRRVIDVSGDGPNNDGRPATAARDAALARGIVINGLPLMTREGMGARWHQEDLDAYYYNCVIGGFGSFVLPVRTWEEFPLAVRRKMVLELADWPAAPVRPPASRPGVTPVAGEAYDCLVGERIWNMMFEDTY